MTTPTTPARQVPASDIQPGMALLDEHGQRLPISAITEMGDWRMFKFEGGGRSREIRNDELLYCAPEFVTRYYAIERIDEGIFGLYDRLTGDPLQAAFFTTEADAESAAKLVNQCGQKMAAMQAEIQRLREQVQS